MTNTTPRKTTPRKTTPKNISIARGWTLLCRNGIWHLRINHKNRCKYISTGERLDSAARSKATAIWQKYHHAMASLFNDDVHLAMVFADVWVLYLKKRRHALRPTSISTQYSTLSRFYASFSRTQIVRDTSADDIIAYLSQPCFAPDTASKEFVNLHSFFAKCVLFGFIQQNPMRTADGKLIVEKPKRTSRKAHNWRDTEVRKIITAIEHDYAQKIKANLIREGEILGIIPVIYIALSTGLRRSEMQYLRWCDVDFHQQRIYVRAYSDPARGRSFEIKGYAERAIPMNPLSEHYLRQLAQARTNEDDGDLVFTGRGGGRRRFDWVSKRFSFYAREAGFTDARHFHDLRKLYATKRLEAGASPRVIQDELGHQSLETTLGYLGINQDTDLAKNDAIFAQILAKV